MTYCKYLQIVKTEETKRNTDSLKVYNFGGNALELRYALTQIHHFNGIFREIISNNNWFTKFNKKKTSAIPNVFWVVEFL